MDQYLILFFGYYSFETFLMESGKFDKNMIGSGCWKLSSYFYSEQWEPLFFQSAVGRWLQNESFVWITGASTLIGSKKKQTINHKIFK